jgi:hypothetical protein
MLPQHLHGVVGLRTAAHSGRRQRHNHSLRYDDVPAFSIRKTNLDERKQLFRRIFDQPGRIRAAPEPEPNPLEPPLDF